MMRQAMALAGWVVGVAGAFALLFGGGWTGSQSEGLLSMGPWATAGVVLIGLGLCVQGTVGMKRSER